MKETSISYLSTLLLLIICLFQSCVNPNNPVSDSELISFEFSDTELSIPKGGNKKISVAGIYQSGKKEDISHRITWTSSNKKVGTISNDPAQKGLFAALGQGKTTITAYLNDINAFIEITVSPAELTAINISPLNTALALETDLKFIAIGIFTDNTHGELSEGITWSSSLPEVLNIDPTGTAKGLSVGKSKITASVKGITAQTEISVTFSTLLSIEISPIDFTLNQGMTVKMKAAGIFSDNTSQDISGVVSWESPDPNIATINKDGLVTALNEGALNIKASYNNVNASATLYVTASELVSINLTTDNTGIIKGIPSTTKATGTFADGSVQDITDLVEWKTDNTTVATINSAGILTGGEEGTTKIDAKLGDKTGTAEVIITAPAIVSINISPEKPTLVVKSTLQLKAEGLFSNQTKKDLTLQMAWSTSDSTIASVSNAPGNEGLINGLTVGTVNITAKYGEINGSVYLTVKNLELKKLNLSSENIPVYKGTTNQFKAMGVYADESIQDFTKKVIWSSSDSLVAGVSNLPGKKGLVTGLAPGTTEIEAEIDSISAKILFTVKPPDLLTLDITPKDKTIDEQTTIQFSITGKYSDGTTKYLKDQVSWTVSDENIAIIDLLENIGLVTAISPGSVKIKATFENQTAETNLTINKVVIPPDIVVPELTGKIIFKDDFESSNNILHTTQTNLNENQWVKIINTQSSPFSQGSKSMEITDKDTTASLYSPTVNIDIQPALTKDFILSLDFLLLANDQYPTLKISGTDLNAPGIILFLNDYAVDKTAEMGYFDKNKSRIILQTIKTNVWYRAIISVTKIDNLEDTWNLRLQEHDGQKIIKDASFPNLSFRNNLDQIEKVIWMFNTPAGTKGGSFILDNVEVRTGSADKISLDIDLLKKRAIGNVSLLDRKVYMTYHGSNNVNGLTNEIIENLLVTNRANTGRAIGWSSYWAANTIEDINRSGFVDLKSIKDLGTKSLSFAPNSPIYKKFFNSVSGLDMIWTDKPDIIFNPLNNIAVPATAKYAPKSIAGAVDFLGNIFTYGTDKVTVPRYFEPLNEPDAHNYSWDSITNFHLNIKNGLKDFSNIKIGGPTLCCPRFLSGDGDSGFGLWNDQMKKFILKAGNKMDFLSMHLYNSTNDASEKNLFGTRLEAILDLVEAYSKEITGMVKPFVFSEYGTGFPEGSKIKDTNTPYRDWLILRGVNNLLFDLLERPNRILKAVPFILPEASWDNDSPHVMNRKNGDAWEETHLIKFYRLWRNVDGERVLANSEDTDIRVRAFRDGNKAYIGINSLELADKYISLNILNNLSSKPDSIVINRLYYDPVTKKPILEETPVTNLQNLEYLKIRSYETIIIELSYASLPLWEKSINEQSYYSAQVIVPITAKKEEQIKISIPDLSSMASYASLRLSMGRALNTSLTPTVKFNGTPISVPVDYNGESQNAWGNFFGAKTLVIPVNLLQKENTLSVTFNEGNYAISSVVLTVGWEIQ